MNQIRPARRRLLTSPTLGAGTEEDARWAARLERHCDDQVLLLPHRRPGGGSSGRDILHLAVAPTGVVVIDGRSCPDARVRVNRRGGRLRPPTERLFVHGLDSTWLLSGLARRRQLVAREVARLAGPEVPVTSMLCLLGAQLPLFGDLEVQGVPVRSPRDAGRLLRRSGPLDPAWRRDLWERLAEVLPPSSGDAGAADGAEDGAAVGAAP